MSSEDPTRTQLLSSFLTKLGDDTGYLVRLYPVTVGEGVVALPRRGTVIGRDAECGIVLEDVDVSRHHASIELREEAYILKDLGSRNGTTVNDRRVTEAPLQSGDRIGIGRGILKFMRGYDVETQYHETIYAMTIQDALTGIPNRRFLMEALRREIVRSHRHRRPLSVAMIDIDHFKKVNDRYGHFTGDAVLRDICGRFRASIRADEVFARYGGEEFVLVLPEATLEQAREMAERLRALASAKPVSVNAAQIPVTVSLGLAFTQGEEVTAEELIARADKKLYDAKTTGRNKVCG
ncbi:MAG: FHA domain-containing [Planctomycetota bacterium]|nr:MAG: FHA domain-containing [Planctomycetota bacterium]